MASEENIYDLVVDELTERQRMVKDELRSRFAKTRPFRMEPMSNDEALYYYNQLTPDRMSQLIETYGREAVNEMIYQFESLKRKKEVR